MRQLIMIRKYTLLTLLTLLTFKTHIFNWWLKPVYEAVEDNEGCEGENSDDNGGSSWHLQRSQYQYCDGCKWSCEDNNDSIGEKAIISIFYFQTEIVNFIAFYHNQCQV